MEDHGDPRQLGEFIEQHDHFPVEEEHHYDDLSSKFSSTFEYSSSPTLSTSFLSSSNSSLLNNQETGVEGDNSETELSTNNQQVSTSDGKDSSTFSSHPTNNLGSFVHFVDQLDLIKSKYEKTQSELKAKQDQLRMISKILDDCIGQKNDYLREIEEHIRLKADLETKNVLIDLELQASHVRLTTLKENYNKEYARLKQSKQQAERDRTDTFNKYFESMRSLQQELRARNKIELITGQMKEEIEAKKQELAMLSQQYKAKEKAFHEENQIVKELEERIQHLDRIKQEKLDSLQKLKARHIALKGELGTLNQELSDLSQEEPVHPMYQELNARLQALRTHATDLNQRYFETKTKLEQQQQQQQRLQQQQQQRATASPSPTNQLQQKTPPTTVTNSTPTQQRTSTPMPPLSSSSSYKFRTTPTANRSTNVSPVSLSFSPQAVKGPNGDDERITTKNHKRTFNIDDDLDEDDFLLNLDLLASTTTRPTGKPNVSQPQRKKPAMAPNSLSEPTRSGSVSAYAPPPKQSNPNTKYQAPVPYHQQQQQQQQKAQGALGGVQQQQQQQTYKFRSLNNNNNNNNNNNYNNASNTSGGGNSNNKNPYSFKKINNNSTTSANAATTTQQQQQQQRKANSNGTGPTKNFSLF